MARDSDKNTAPSSQTWQPDANLNRSTARLVATEKTQIDTGRRWQHNFWVSDLGYLENVYSNLRQKIGFKPGDEMLDTYVNALIWGMFTTATTNAAVHFGKDCEENVHSIINTRGQKVRQLFEVSPLLIEEQWKSVEYQRLNGR